MVDKYISAQHIQKLGHKIQEIRERALFNIVSKLENGVLFDNDLARSKDLLKYLCKWFLFEPCSQEEVVFLLLKRILKSESGKILINHIGKCALQKEIQQIRSYLEPAYHPYLEELLQIVESQDVDCVVPPLVSDIPLSYRSDANTYDIESTATSFRGFLQKNSSVELQTGADSLRTTAQSQPSTRPNSRLTTQTTLGLYDNLPNYYFQLQPLIEPDRHVLQSIEKSLTDPSHPSVLIHSCQFFDTVLINDFPPEIFLQRPRIVFEFYSLLTFGSSRIANAVLGCLYELTKALQIRILHESDMCLKNNYLKKLDDFKLPGNSPTSPRTEDGLSSNRPETFESQEEIELLQKNQLPTPKFCLLSVCAVLKYLLPKEHGDNFKLTQLSINLCLMLLEKLLNVLPLTINIQVWERPQTDRTLKILKDFNEILVRFGDSMEYFRLESLMTETDLRFRAIYLYLVHICVHTLKVMVPLDKTAFILPNNLKSALSNCLLDVALARLYPSLHGVVLNYVQSFSEMNSDHLKKYKDMESVCNGMMSAMKFIKNSDGLGLNDNLISIQNSIPCLEFIIGDLAYIKVVVDFLSEKLPQVSEDCEKIETAEEIILNLLAYNTEIIREETYRVIHRKVLSSIGPKMDMSYNGVAGAQILFLLSSKVMVEIAMFGLNGENQEIRRYAENILNYILKCKILVCESIWDKVIQSVVPALPIIACNANRATPLGKSIIGLMDPDLAKDIHLPFISMLKTNIQFLFLDDAPIREEAFSRLCWLLSSQENCRDYLPKMNMLYDNTIACACFPKAQSDVNKGRKGNDHFYQPSSLEQVLTILKSPDVEPSIRRSALNQISVMMEDLLLHRVFLNSNGIETITATLKAALTEKSYSDYPDAVIPIMGILKNLCFQDAAVRDELSNQTELFYWILRSLFLFFTEDPMKQDAATVLFLLIFKDFIQGNPSRGNFSLPAVVIEKMRVPFQSNSHWISSPNSHESLKEAMIKDPWCLTSLQIQWNCELLGGFEKLVQQATIDYNTIYCADVLKLNENDLAKVKTSSVHYCVGHYINKVENSTSHSSVVASIELLTLYTQLYKISKTLDYQDDEKFVEHPWQRCFSRFLKSLPSSLEDILLLNEVIVFLNILVEFYSKGCWVTSFLKEENRCLLDLISSDNAVDENSKMIGQSLLKLLTSCVRKEQWVLEYRPSGEQEKNGVSWKKVVRLIVENLKSSGAQHFYNLAYLDSLLACLVHLTAKLGWSSHISDIQPLVSSLRELLDAFHKGKGASASYSVMGLSITRHSILILNHLLAELQYSKMKNWELCFLDEDYNQAVNNFIELWSNRDVVVRAAALQLLCGLTVSPRISSRLIEEVEDVFFTKAVAILLDSREAAVVRENAAQMLANLAGMSAPLGTEKPVSGQMAVLKKSFTLKLFNMLEESGLYSSLEDIIENLFTLNISDVGKPFDGMNWIKDYTSSSSSSVSTDNSRLATTPGLIKAVTNLLHNVLVLDFDNVSRKLQELGLVKLFFRTLCSPSMDVSHTAELMLYCDVLEMNIAVCCLLTRLAGRNIVCLGTILHTKDCLSLLVSLLNAKLYNTDFPQLIYLKNKLWTEIFNLISTLLESSDSLDGNITYRSLEAAGILSSTIFGTGTPSFLATWCESFSSVGSKDLQVAALTSFTCLTRTEILRIYQEANQIDDYPGQHVKDLLDYTRSPKSVVIIDSKENNKPVNLTKKKEPKMYSEKHKMNLLEDAYFGRILPVKKHHDSELEINFVDDKDSALMAGAEICKIFLYLYDISDLNGDKEMALSKKKHLVTSALSGLLCVSIQAKKHALHSGLVEIIVKQLRANHVRVTLESGDYVKKVSDKRKLKVCPVLKETADLVSLLNNFMLDDDAVKEEAAALYLADVVHKFWVWFLLQNTHLVDVLKMLCTFTTRCNLACQTLPLTSPIAGAGPRKSPSNGSLLHALINLINKEMEQISKTHDLTALDLSFNVLQNCCSSLECRVLISKSNIFQSISRLQPASSKRQKPWENIEFIWLQFLEVFTSHPEGQTCVAKIVDVLELILKMATISRLQNRELAMMVLRNLAFYQPNKPRLLGSGDFLCTLKSKMSNGTNSEKKIVTSIIWSLIANSQKAKVLLKSAQLDVQLQNTIRSQLVSGTAVPFTTEELDQMHYVLSILRDNTKNK